MSGNEVVAGRCRRCFENLDDCVCDLCDWHYPNPCKCKEQEREAQAELLQAILEDKEDWLDFE